MKNDAVVPVSAATPAPSSNPNAVVGTVDAGAGTVLRSPCAATPSQEASTWATASRAVRPPGIHRRGAGGRSRPPHTPPARSSPGLAPSNHIKEPRPPQNGVPACLNVNATRPIGEPDPPSFE